jgi:hypothetical protein
MRRTAGRYGGDRDQATIGQWPARSGAFGSKAGSNERLVFSLGVLGASIVAAIVCSLALARALSKAAGHR